MGEPPSPSRAPRARVGLSGTARPSCETAGDARTPRPRCRRLAHLVLRAVERPAPFRGSRLHARRAQGHDGGRKVGRSRLGRRRVSATASPAAGVGVRSSRLSAGAAALVLSMGPAAVFLAVDGAAAAPIRSFSSRLVSPCPGSGGAVNRFQALVTLRLRSGVAFAATRLLSGRRRALAAAEPVLAFVEYAPSDPGESAPPFHPPHPPMARDLVVPAARRRSRHRPGQPRHDSPSSSTGARQSSASSRAPPARLVAAAARRPRSSGRSSGRRRFPGLSLLVAGAARIAGTAAGLGCAPGFPGVRSAGAPRPASPEIGRSDPGDLAVVYRVPEEVVPPVASRRLLSSSATNPAAAKEEEDFLRRFTDGPERALG